MTEFRPIDSLSPDPLQFGGAPTSAAARPEIVVLLVEDNPLDRLLATKLLSEGMAVRVVEVEDGLQAVAELERELPDLVLTDLQLPHMDGLSLVKEVRRRFPTVPTVLMTAHGSEEVAVSALQSGAANYVPKQLLAKRLVETVRDVLTLSDAGRRVRHLQSCWARSEFEFVLWNDTSIILPLVTHLQQYAANLRPTDETEQLRIAVALHEALRNAMHHGNLELGSELRSQGTDPFYAEAERRRFQPPYASRRVYLRVQETPLESRFFVRDEGSGFDVHGHLHDPTDEAYLDRVGGRGLFLMRTFMDEVQFNDAGNEVMLIHRRPPVH